MDVVSKLETLLKNELGSSKKIVNTKITSLTNPGDNNGSLMLKLDVVIEDKNGKNQENLAMVAKKIPRSVLFQKIFNIQQTFKKEIAFYKTIIPTLEDFVKRNKDKKLQLFAKYYASRFNLKDNEDVIDEDGVLIIENLKTIGYLNLDCKVGFDFETTKLILKSLAEFHAVPLALKLKNSTLFKEKIEKYCPENSFASDRYVELNKFSRQMLTEDKECALFAEKVNFLDRKNKQPVSNNYGTIVHSDLWGNNVMLRLENEKAVDIKLVDFQIYHYGSPGSDLFFLLFTSVQKEVLTKHLDDLIKYYHEQFVSNLQELNCDISSYTLESLYEEIKIHSKFEFGHAFFFNAFIINMNKEQAAEGSSGKPEHLMKHVTQEGKEKCWFFAKECEKRRWLPKSE